jgi:hypothetical protein
VTGYLISGSLLAAALAVLAVAAWFWRQAGQGRHRRARRPGPLLQLPPGVPTPDGPYGTEAVLLTVPPTPSVLQLQEDEDQEEGDGAPDTETVALLAADRADFAHCPDEGRRAPHFFHSDGSRTCCRCETTTAGDQT